jgi:hypothetical protein
VHLKGSKIDVVEEWRGREWSRITHSIVEAQPVGALVTHEHRGTVGVYASSRGIPGREGLSRSERKFRALETLQVCMREIPAPIDTLYFWEPGRHSRVNRGWSEGEFLGWYVDFVRPPSIRPDRIVTMDLVLDALVTPDGTWSWKDRDDFNEAWRRGLVTEAEAAEVWAEAMRVQADLQQRQGAFAPAWDAWRPRG